MLKQFLEWMDSGGDPAHLLDICKRRIAERNAELHAFRVTGDHVPDIVGPLRGIPFGVKDLFDTVDFTTEFGSPVYKGRVSVTDAALVGRLRALGAVVLGKTETTAFAYFDPAPTRNPRNPEHTPGGSSSGSAAAVADGMVPFALGTQTGGSIVRPASFCGVAGFKPTFGKLPMQGVQPFAPSLDTAGFFTQTAEEMQLLWIRAGLGGESVPAARIGAILPLPPVDRAMSRAVTSAAAVLHAAPAELPNDFWEMVPAARTINNYEGARTLEARWREHGDRIGPKLAVMVEEGLRISEESYQRALSFAHEMRETMSPLFREYPVLVLPAAIGPAPAGLASTGDPKMNSPWTALGCPAISVPLPVTGLPLGLQLVAAPGADDVLLATAAHAEAMIKSCASA